MAEGEGDFYSKENPDNKAVNAFHTNDDVDVNPQSHHHTLGSGINQAASGSHTHRGDDSVLLFEGIAITGSISGGTALRSVIAALAELGATDSTSA